MEAKKTNISPHDFFHVFGLEFIIDRKFKVPTHGAFDQQFINGIGLVNKISIHIHNYLCKFIFLNVLLKYYNVIIYMRCHHDLNPVISYSNNTISFSHANKNIVIEARKYEKPLPIFQHVIINNHALDSTNYFLVLACDHKSVYSRNLYNVNFKIKSY